MLGAWLPLLQQNAGPTFGAVAAETVPISEAGYGYAPGLVPLSLEVDNQPVLKLTPIVLESPLFPNSLITCQVTVTDTSGNLFSPSIMELDVLHDGATTPYTGAQILNPRVGVFQCNVLALDAGPYYLRWKSSAVGQQCTIDDSFTVSASDFS